MDAEMLKTLAAKYAAMRREQESTYIRPVYKIEQMVNKVNTSK